MRLDIKPMSTNKAYAPVKGRIIKTKLYRRYERDVMLLLRPMTIPEGELEVIIKWGLFNYGQSDWDNPIKPFVDILQKKYGFNDNRIFRGTAEKVKTKKGEEFIEFEILGRET